MKILLVDTVYKYGSTGKIMFNLFSHIQSKGEEAFVCYGRGKRIKEKNVFKFGFDIETLFHAFLTRVTGFTGCFSYFSTKRLIKIVKKIKPDIVHLHEIHAYYLNTGKFLNFLKKEGIKVIHTLHCAFSYTGKCGHHLDCDKWKTVCHDCPRLRDYVSTLFFDNTRKMFLEKKKSFTGFKDLTIVCPSNWLANYAKESFLGQYPVLVIRNGIDLNVFYNRRDTKLREKLGISKESKIVLSVAPNIMSESKGGHWVLKLAEQFSCEDVYFVLIGVDKPIKDVPKNVFLFGKTNNQDELANFYSAADLFVICSKMENFPTTCLEAQACGTFVCGFDVGGVKETSISKNNFFVDYGNISELATKMRYFFANKKVDSFDGDVSILSNSYMNNLYYNLYLGKANEK